MLKKLHSGARQRLVVPAFLLTLALTHHVAAQSRPFVSSLPLTLNGRSLSEPEESLRRAATHKDLRFMGVRGFALSVPGVSGGTANPLVRAKGVAVIPGTGDSVHSVTERRFQQQASRYALNYNQRLLSLLKNSKDPDWERVQQEITEELRRMAHDDPIADAEKSCHAGDRRLLAISLGGNRQAVPGLPVAQTVERPLRNLTFSPEMANSSQRLALHDVIRRYIEPYNRYVYQNCRSNSRFQNL